MKTTSSLFIGILLFLTCGSANSKEVTGSKTAVQQGAISVMCTPDLFELTSKWASEYHSLNPEAKIRVINVTGNNINPDANENLNFISHSSQAAIDNDANWKMVVARDVIVPVMNAGNPFLKEIAKRGVSAEQFAEIFNKPEKQNWGTLLASSQNAPVHIYFINDENTKAAVAKFLQSAQVPANGVTLGTSAEVIAAIQKDPYAIGFCKVVNIMSPDNRGLIENISLLPIDRNGNGSIDHMEDIYSDLPLFLRGVWIGKYPKVLYNDIYVAGKVQPTDASELAFLKWVLTDGQQFLNSQGYCDLDNSETQSQLDKINTAVISVPPSMDATLKGLIVLISAALIALIMIVNAIVRRSGNKKQAVSGIKTALSGGFGENSVLVPNGLYFDKTHTWAFMEKDGTVTIGIDDFMQHITGPITRIEMKNPGDRIKKGDPLFSIIQSGKQLSLYAPVSGIIKKQNESLITDSSFLNSSPYAQGWVYMIEPDNWYKEIQFMDMGEKYKRWLDTEFSRVKDFLAATLKHDSIEYAHIVLQDGGVLKDGVLSDFGPKIWEDFQTNFLDKYK